MTRSRLTPEHLADMAIHCTLAGAFVWLVMAGLAVQRAVELKRPAALDD